MKRYVLFFIFLITFIYNVHVSALGAGALDPLFGTNSSGVFDASGTVATNFGNFDSSFAVAIQADGKILVGGGADITGVHDFALVRYNLDGTLDSSFGSSGTVTTNFGGSEEIEDIIIQSDGKIVVVGFTTAGASTQNFAIARYNTDGSLDTSFNPGGALGDVPNVAGLLNLDITGGVDFVKGVALQQDQKMVIVGGDGISDDAIVIRLNSNGSLDTTFNAGGVLGGAPNTAGIITFDFGVTDASEVAIANDGSIFVVGSGEPDGTTHQMLLKLTQFATFDTEFGTGIGDIFDGSGTVFDKFGATSLQGKSIALQLDGKILVGSNWFMTNDNRFAVARYNSDGTLDSAFGADASGAFDGSGFTVTDFAGFPLGTASELGIQSTGKIVFGGAVRTTTVGSAQFAVVRYNINGTLDNTFDGDGRALTALGDSGARSLAVQFDDKVLLAGTGDGASSRDIVTARYTTDSVVDPTANDDTFDICTDSQNIFLPVLANDLVGEGDSLKVISVTIPTNGTATIVGNGAGVKYDTPGGGFTGGDSFDYTAQNEAGATDTATVIITISGNSGPNAVDDIFTICANNLENHLYVVSNDFPGCDKNLEIVSFTQGIKGTVSQVSSKVLNYAPNGTKGTDSFTYTIEDGNGNSDIATVNITVV